MKKKSLRLLLIGLILGVGFTGCSKENELDPGQAPLISSSVDFLVSSDSIIHSPDSLNVEVKLNRPASMDGHVSVRLSGNAVHGQDFTTKPEAVNGIIRLEFLNAMQSAKFTIFRSDQLQTEKTLNLTLEDPTEGFELGTRVSYSVKLFKGQEPADSVNFSDVFIQIMESVSNGHEIKIKLSGPISNTENIYIDLSNTGNFQYGTHYLTNPAAVLNELKLEVIPGMDNVSFTIIPVNDNIIQGSYEVLFKINAVTGQLQKGTNDELIVRIEEDDHIQAEIHTIAELKNEFSAHEGEFWLTDDYYIEGIITSGSNVIDNKTAYIQDASSGIMLRFTVQNFLNQGDKVKINLKGGSGNVINGQKAIVNIHDMLGIKLGENQVVLPEVISLEQLVTGAFEGKRVRINDVSFPDANGTSVFKGNRPVIKGTSGAIVTTYQTAPFSNIILPGGNLSVIGIVGDWGHLLPQVYTHDIIK